MVLAQKSIPKNIAVIALSILLVLVVLVTGLSLAYTGKIYSGVSINGIDVGGLTKDEAKAKVEKARAIYMSKVLPISHGSTSVQVPLSALAPTVPDTTYAQAFDYGRGGSLREVFHARLRTIFARPTNYYVADYKAKTFAPYLIEISEAAARPVSNARISVVEGAVMPSSGASGIRFNNAGFVNELNARLTRFDTGPIIIPVFQIDPAITNADVSELIEEVKPLIEKPVTLKIEGGEDRLISSTQLADWIDIGSTSHPTDIAIGFDVTKVYATNSGYSGALEYRANEQKVKVYIADLGRELGRDPVDAGLGVADGKVVVTSPSRSGITINVKTSQSLLAKELEKPSEGRVVKLPATVVKPQISEETISQLGITELIGEGVSFFPGSDAARLQNIRAGALAINGTILKPGQVFSAGETLGDVSAATGYAPAKVIIGKRIEIQYGGGLCQVTSTVFRAALNSGLPIVERVNHSYAISYYTAPYGTPGVDATIYYPQVDLKFRNDTSGHVLVQSILQGTTLTFRLYGTKTKSGVIRGPEFISGTLDHTKPSRTVFYRDVVDKDGKVIKTDAFYTSYQSSTEFTQKPQYN